jgi:hypothetical protein
MRQHLRTQRATHADAHDGPFKAVEHEKKLSRRHEHRHRSRSFACRKFVLLTATLAVASCFAAYYEYRVVTGLSFFDGTTQSFGYRISDPLAPRLVANTIPNPHDALTAKQERKNNPGESKPSLSVKVPPSAESATPRDPTCDTVWLDAQPNNAFGIVGGISDVHVPKLLKHGQVLNGGMVGEGEYSFYQVRTVRRCWWLDNKHPSLDQFLQTKRSSIIRPALKQVDRCNPLYSADILTCSPLLHMLPNVSLCCCQICFKPRTQSTSDSHLRRRSRVTKHLRIRLVVYPLPHEDLPAFRHIGDPDLYVSVTNTLPTLATADFISAGLGDEVLELSTELPDVPDDIERLFISVLGNTPARFDIGAWVEEYEVPIRRLRGVLI